MEVNKVKEGAGPGGVGGTHPLIHIDTRKAGSERTEAAVFIGDRGLAGFIRRPHI